MSVSSWVVLAVAVCSSIPLRVAAQEDDQKREIEELRKEVRELREAVRALQDALRRQPPATPSPLAATEEEKRLEEEIRAAVPEQTPVPAPAAPAPVTAAAGKSSSILNPDLSFIGDFTFLGTDNNQLNKANRFSFREAEVGFQAPIDPFARADAFVTVDEDGNVDIEEAYATFLTLPANLQARAGKFRLLFGKNNVLHRHALPQTDRPFAEVENFGEEGLEGTGVEVSYLVPNPWDQYVLLTAEAVNEPTSPTGNEQGAPLAGVTVGRTFRDFAYVGHAQSFVDLSADSNVELGGSVFVNLPKTGTQTMLYGADLTYRWRPLSQAGYRQFLWRTEAYVTRRELRDADLAVLAPGEGNRFHTVGVYTYGEYRLGQRWWAGARADWTELPAQRHGVEWGLYPYVTFAPTEFGYFRLGYQYAESDRLRRAPSNRVWLQYDFSIGPHAAHAF